MTTHHPHVSLPFEFHVARRARDRYRFDQALFASSGNVLFADFHAARVFAQRMNETRDLARFPEQAVKAGQINALGLIDEILHGLCRSYREQVNPQAMAGALARLDLALGPEAVDRTLLRFVEHFPPVRVYRGEEAAADYLAGTTDGISHREAALEELLMLWLENANPAFAPYRELFDDSDMERETAYRTVISELQAYFAAQPPLGPDNRNLIDLLRAPALAAPHSLTGQLDFIRTRLAPLLGVSLFRMLSGLDFIREEEKPVFFGPGPALVPTFGPTEEPERFSPDRDWMPNTVLIAKNTYVWLDQLSRQYGQAVTRLDQIPDAELDTLARRGFTALWLIGLWERSPASQRIKQMCGNPEAVASAYSLAGYEIAADLGGPEALNSLRERARQRGIRLASDMVPNHMGIDSRWVIEHPDWFLALDHSPFPAYSFNGPNLASDERVGIYLEDHYYSRSDAAVVFKRVDFLTGSERYVYHGNDGTNMPWNDTAQLNFLNPETREAVIQTILHVARQFPIIRFDAAMTLAKKHYQRLWFPEPGSGGAIPTRAEHGMTRAEFDAAMPEEFWREVVDRVAQEAPDTLLLAEAFWLMEGYFVRTLGMHRVYNSAFMNMLRDEDNARYRQVLKNTLEFDPDILKRYVNFLNNPDEHTSVEQFGKGDKYFGICMLLCTLPGLPMFGHGQVEGYAEKYGMEYRRAYWDEQPDAPFAAHHERILSPLLHKRYLFAEARDFLLYDFRTAEGGVNEDVFAYSNRSGGERALILYHNRYAEARGRVHLSASYAVKEPDGTKRMMRRTLGEALGLRPEAHRFVLFRDAVTGEEFLRSSRDLCENGLYVELGAYQHRAFLDFTEIEDNEWRQYAQLNAFLGGRGVPGIEAALREIQLQPIHLPFRELIHPGFFRYAEAASAEPAGAPPGERVLEEAEAKTRAVFEGIRAFEGVDRDVAPLSRAVRARWEAALRLSAEPEEGIGAALRAGLEEAPSHRYILYGWLAVHALGQAVRAEAAAETARSLLEEWQLGRMLAGTLQELGLDSGAADYAVTLIKALTRHQDWFAGTGDGAGREARLETLLADADVQRLLRVNRHQGVLWYNQEAFEQLLWWLLAIAAVALRAAGRPESDLEAAYQMTRAWQRASEASGYRVDSLLDRVV